MVKSHVLREKAVFWVLFKSNTLNERMFRPVLIKKRRYNLFVGHIIS